MNERERIVAELRRQLETSHRSAVEAWAVSTHAWSDAQAAYQLHFGVLNESLQKALAEIDKLERVLT